MARRKADAPIDLAQPHALTAGLIAALRCPEGKEQAFLRDADTKGLRVRVTAAGAKSYVFEAKVNGKTLRRTIGDAKAWTIPRAQAEANRLRVLVDQKTDPRDLERLRAEAAELARVEAQASAEAEAQAQAARALTVGTAWARYVAERRPHWGERNYADHLSMTHEGGKARKRLAGVATKPGPLAPIMSMRLVDLDAKAVEAWAIEEAIPPDLPRDEWVRAGMAAHAAGLPFDEFDAWSAGGGNYDARAARDTWRSFKDGKGLGPGTLFRMAAELGGYGKRRQRPAEAQEGPVERTKAPRPGMGAAEVWRRCVPAAASHAYIEAKQGTADGLRVVFAHACSLNQRWKPSRRA